MNFILFGGHLVNFSLVINSYMADPHPDDQYQTWEIRVELLEDHYISENFNTKTERDGRFAELIALLGAKI